MDLAFEDWKKIASDQQSGKGSDDCLPLFYKKAIEDKVGSEQEGRPIFKEFDYVNIIILGDKNTQVNRKVTDEDKKRWPNQWERYQKNQEQNGVEGSLLEQWPQLSVSQVAELKALHVYTVEQLANLSDAALLRIGMGARELKRKAEVYLYKASKQAMVNEQVRLESENQELKDKVNELQNMVLEMRDHLAETALPKKGRPRKKDDTEE